MPCHKAVQVLLLAVLTGGNAHPALTLAEVERQALADDPAIGAVQARARALEDMAVADGQLPDPQLRTGIYNLPLDNFDLEREPTTQFRLGIMQAFPRGDTLHYRQEQGEWMARAEQARAETARRTLLRDVRNGFLELYYQLQAELLIGKTRRLFAQLEDITRAHYATGRVNQQDVLRASLELSRLDDRTTRIRNEADRARALLSKWIGDSASLELADGFPDMPALPAKTTLEARLPEHPAIHIETAKIEASNRKISMTREQYKPGWSAGLEYRKRFGDDPGGDDRADMMAAMLTVDLPLFTNSRQDRRLSASIRQAESAQLARADRLRELRQMLDSEYASWQRLGERTALYESQLLREASANAQASLNAYQSGTTEFTTLMRARITDLDMRLDALRARVDRARAQAALLYLAGEE
ncbi:MAG: TolC family protein [Thiohalobacterales bacterium]|nr:TolC family protein [Thiohalobacterales bacterium]